MRKLIVVLALPCLFLSCGSSKQVTGGDNVLTVAEKNEGWKLLFNGRNSKGWHRYGGGSIDSVWKVRNGTLCLDTLIKKQQNIRGDWDIVTDEEFDNFDLKLDWMISKNGNSGIILYIYENKAKHNWPWETGM